MALFLYHDVYISKPTRQPNRVVMTLARAASVLLVLAATLLGRVECGEPYSIAWGLFAHGCPEVEAFHRACIGCSDAGSVGIVLVDTSAHASSAAARAPSCGLDGVHTLHTATLLPLMLPPLPPSDRRASSALRCAATGA
jgi:hypothetical protein